MKIRHANEADAGRISVLLDELGYTLTPRQVREKLAAATGSALGAVLLAVTDEPPMDEPCVLGCISLHALPMFHLAGALGRITALVVTGQARGRGVGRALPEAAHTWFETHGCSKFGLTSGDRRHAAHRFYESYGYRRDSRRFVRQVAASI